MKKYTKNLSPEALEAEKQSRMRVLQARGTPQDIQAYYTEKIDMVYFEILKSLKNYQNYNMIDLNTKIKNLLNQISTQNYVGNGGLIEGGTYGAALRDYVVTLSNAPTLKDTLNVVSRHLSIESGDSLIPNLIDSDSVGYAALPPNPLASGPDLLAPAPNLPAPFPLPPDQKPPPPNPQVDPFADLVDLHSEGLPKAGGRSRRRRRSRRR
jgi:hypothetical protein